jgi:hypothetical protein
MDAMIADRLAALGAPSELIEWAADKSFAQVWNECPRGDWMMAMVAPGLKRESLVLLALACAEPALKYVKGSTYTLHNATVCARNWCKGMANAQLLSLAIKQANEEHQHDMQSVINTTDRMKNPVAHQASDFARYGILAAVNSAMSPPDAQNAVMAVSQCQMDTTLARSAEVIRTMVSLDDARKAFGA